MGHASYFGQLLKEQMEHSLPATQPEVENHICGSFLFLAWLGLASNNGAELYWAVLGHLLWQQYALDWARQQ